MNIFLYNSALTDGFIENDTGPITRCELCLSDVCDLTGLRAAHPHAFTDDETIGILGQDHTVVCKANKGKQLY